MYQLQAAYSKLTHARKAFSTINKCMTIFSSITSIAGGLFNGVSTGIGGLFGTVTAKLALAAVVAAGVLVGIGYWYFTYTNHEIHTLETNNAQLSTAVQMQNATIKSLQDTAREQAQQLSTLQDSMNSADARERALLSKLNKTNINDLASKDNAAASALLNSTTSDLFRSIEKSTGANRDAAAKEANK
jgi:hypothetical protein